jgi:very-short-patch-repair endonuclease
MGESTPKTAEEDLWDLAESQHGLVTRQQLLDLTYTPKAIQHRLKARRLHRVSRGLYAVGWPEMNPLRRWMGAVLVSGKSAALSHRSAGALWEIAKEGGAVETTVRRSEGPDRPELRVRRRPTLPSRDLTIRELIPVTTPDRTLVDLATVLGAHALERAVNDADKLDLVVAGDLAAVAERFRGEPGVRRLRQLLARDSFCLSDSTLEVIFRRIAPRAGLPIPETKRVINGFEVDFFWQSLGLVVETDGLRYHRTAASQTRDRLRDQAHTAAGLTTLRFTHWQVQHREEEVIEVLRKTAVHLRSRESDHRSGDSHP